jgi:hypothetical protein
MCSVFYIIVCLFLFFPLYCLSFFDLRLLTTSLVSSNHSYVQQIYMTTMTPMVSVLLKHVTTSILEWYKYYSLIVCKNLYERVRTCIVQSFVILYLFIPNVRYDFRIMKKKKKTNNDIKNTTHKTKNRATWTPLKTGSELKCSKRVGISCSTCATLATNPVICHEWGKDRIVILTNGTYMWS